MSAHTKIEWADHTFNPWIGCTKVGAGCDNCYAKSDFDDRKHRVTWGAGQARSRTKTWGDPVRWNKQHEAFFAEHGRRQRVFCASLADVFDNEVDPQWRVDLFRLIYQTPNLDWLLLSKRIGNAEIMMLDAAKTLCDDKNIGASVYFDPLPWPNIWIGATICNQEEADRDIPKLLAVPAAKRFLSMEPLLGSVDIRRWIATAKVTCKECSSSFWLHDADPCGHRESGSWTLACPHCGDCRCKPGWTPMGARTIDMQPPDDWEDKEVGRFDRVHPTISIRSAIDWIIVGGESGPNARPMHPDWARSLRDQCQAAGVPFLFKQWGEWASAKGLPGYTPIGHVFTDGYQMVRVGKKAAGRLLDGREWNGFPS